MSQRRKQFDENAFDAFLKESMSSESSMDTSRFNKYFQPKKGKGVKKKKSKEPLPWWAEKDDDEDDDDFGLTGTGQSFLKKKEPEKANKKPEKDVYMSRDSLDDESLRDREYDAKNASKPSYGVPALSLGSSVSGTDTMTADKVQGTRSFGKDTLEEMADKERFYNDLQKENNGTVDFHRLNKALDGSETMGTNVGRERLEEEDEDEEDEEEEEEEEDRETQRWREPNKDSQQDKGGMLDKVALLDSLDSTLGTKPAASRETLLDEDMGTIPEGTTEDGVDGHRPSEDTEDNRGTDTNKGFKSTTALGYTDTSRELEAYHQALRQVGMATLDTTKDLTLKDSSTVMGGTQKTPETTGDGTMAFGLKPVAAPVAGGLDDSANGREGRTNEAKPSVHFRDDKDVQEYTRESHGFDLSPIHTQQESLDITPGGDDEEGYDLSPLDKFATEADSPLRLGDTDGGTGGFIHGTPPVPARRSKKTQKKRKEKYANIQSSGYGQKLVDGRTPSPTRNESHSVVGFGSSLKLDNSLGRQGSPSRQGASPGRQGASPARQGASKSMWSPAQVAKTKTQGTEVLRKDGKNLQPSSSLANSQLIASVESFANYLQNQFAADPDPRLAMTSTPQRSLADARTSMGPGPVTGREEALLQEVQDWQNQWKEERKRHAKLHAELSATEHEYNRMTEQQRIEHEQALFKLKQENFVLAAKVTEDADKKSQKRTEGAAKDGKAVPGSEAAQEERQSLLEKEIREQEKLLRGYQQENERLYTEMKKQQVMGKATEEQMFRENQRLTSQLNNLKEETARRPGYSGGSGQQPPTAMLGAGKIAQLEAEVRHARTRELSLQADVDMMQTAKKELEQQIDQMVQQIHQLKEKLEQESGMQSSHYKELQKKHVAETERLQRKLKWYAQNQEMLDRDAVALKEKDAEIKGLQQQLQQQQSEAGRKQLEIKSRAKDRAADAKKIQDLERQVKEMENIVRKRHPNSLPVLMWAAASAGAGPDQPKVPSVQFLEQRIKKLEKEVEEKDEDGKKSLRLLEQKYNAMKAQYEDLISDLEQQLECYRRPGQTPKEGEHPHTHAVALQRELDSIKDRNKRKVAELETELNNARTELANLKNKHAAAERSDAVKAKESDSDLQVRVKALQKQVSMQETEKQQQQQTINKLQREKMQLQSETARETTRATAATRSQLEKKTKSVKAVVDSGRKPSTSDPQTKSKLPLYASKSPRDNKPYEPHNFAKDHVSDVFVDNQELKTRLEQQQLDYEQQRVHLQKLVAEAEARERRVYEDAEHRIKVLKSSHEADVQQLITSHAMQHSVSKQAELQSRVEAQEVLLDQLKEQLRDYESTKEHLTTLHVREATLETQVQQLLLDLKEAKRSHTPEMHHLEALQDKIRQLESRQHRRQQDLQSLSQRTAHPPDLGQHLQACQHMLQAKNKQTEQFRAELDSILGVLKELHKQGITIPVRDPVVSWSS